MGQRKQRHYFGILMALLTLIAFGTRYFDYVWEKNTLIYVYAACDPTEESCFIVDNEDDAWLEFQLTPYKKVEIVEKYAPVCLEEHTCERFSCNNLETCEETLCSDDSLEDGESCTINIRHGSPETVIIQEDALINE